jgi:hypothetical protein
MSEIKVNKISPKQTCTTVTLGDSGDTFIIPSGVTITNNGTQTGFGRTGTVDWDTTAKTASFTAVSGEGYFVNTTSGAITVTLPATPSAGDIIAFKDYAFTFATNNLTVDGNGSPIGGVDGTINPIYSTNGTSKTFIYVDGTKGWLVTNESTDTSQESNALYVTATGGTVTCCGDYKIHTFTGPGTFCVSCAGNACGSNTVDYLVVAGGGGSGKYYGGGGGGGGYRESSGVASGCYSVSPLGACVSALPVSVTTYPITVGGGGATAPSPSPGQGTSGSNSVFSSITSTGGGYGNGGLASAQPSGGPGGSGGGGHAPCSPSPTGGRTGGTGNTPPTSPPQGNPGVTTPAPAWAGAGGGATATGAIRVGGAGATSSINNTPTGRAGGGAGGPCSGSGSPQPGAAGSSDGGGAYNTNGTANTGGGGGSDGGLGGSGIVIIRYKFQ